MTRAQSMFAVLMLGAMVFAQPAGAQDNTQNSGLREAGKRRVEAQTAFNKAQQTLSLIAQRIRAGFETKQEWQQAAAAQKNAQRAFDQTKQPVLDKVRNGDEYKKLAEQKTKTDESLQKLRDRGGNTAEMTALATKSVEYSSEMSKMEIEAVQKDEKIADAKKKLDEANAKMSELRQVADEAMKSDPQWVEAKKAVDEAQVKLAEANKQVADQQKAASEAARAASQSRSRSSSGSRSSGSRPRGY